MSQAAPDDLLAGGGRALSIGRFRVIPERFISEGGFSKVFLCRDIQKGAQMALKHIITGNRELVQSAQREIEVMKLLNHKNIVKLYDSETVPMQGGGVHIYILMEYCSMGHVVGLMNQRLQTRFQEHEILAIFSDTCEAVAHLHYKKPPILHRDLKVENILISPDGLFKLCDFGSCTTQTIPPGTALRGAQLETVRDDIERNTTLQYRAPEMCDLQRSRGLNEKVDIWALGVLLYKLCYFTTPFENEGQFAILNCRYEIPSQPSYSNSLILLLKSLLQDIPERRPNIYRVLESVSKMRASPCPIQNIYVEEEKKIVSMQEDVQKREAGLREKQASGPQSRFDPSLVEDQGPTPGLRRGRAQKSSNSTSVKNTDYNFITKALSNDGKTEVNNHAAFTNPTSLFDDSFGQSIPYPTDTSVGTDFFGGQTAFPETASKQSDPFYTTGKVSNPSSRRTSANQQIAQVSFEVAGTSPNFSQRDPVQITAHRGTFFDTFDPQTVSPPSHKQAGYFIDTLAPPSTASRPTTAPTKSFFDTTSHLVSSSVDSARASIRKLSAGLPSPTFLDQNKKTHSMDTSNSANNSPFNACTATVPNVLLDLNDNHASTTGAAVMAPFFGKIESPPKAHNVLQDPFGGIDEFGFGAKNSALAVQHSSPLNVAINKSLPEIPASSSSSIPQLTGQTNVLLDLFNSSPNVSKGPSLSSSRPGHTSDSPNYGAIRGASPSFARPNYSAVTMSSSSPKKAPPPPDPFAAINAFTVYGASKK